ncbi:hypothetical protein EON63_10795 [archaeon]|nr:MAG: hypothetical protein EON63_10795 [archaeon]
MLILSVIPYFCLTTLPGISIKAVIACYVVTLGVQAFCLQYIGAVFAVTWIVSLDTIVACLIYIQSYTQIQLFIFFTKIEELRGERSVDSDRQQQEMRNLIGKLAHDLRTVRAKTY